MTRYITQKKYKRKASFAFSLKTTKSGNALNDCITLVLYKSFFRNLTQWKYLLIHVCKSLVMNYPSVYEEGGKIVSLLNLTITIIPMTHFSNIIILNVSKKILGDEPSQAWLLLKSTKSFMYINQCCLILRTMYAKCISNYS